MKNFINKLMDIGASHDKSCSKEESEEWIKEAEKEYKIHLDKLNSATPVMLEALEFVVENIGKPTNWDGDILEKAKQAIEKSTR